MTSLGALRSWLGRIDEQIAALALGLMMLIPVIEIAMRPMMGSGIANAPVVVQHLGLVLAMFGALDRLANPHLWRERLPACHVVFFANAGSQPDRERPHALARAAGAFLRTPG